MPEESHNEILRELGEIKGTLRTFIKDNEKSAVIQDDRINQLEGTARDHGRTISIHTGGIAVLGVLVTVGVPALVKFFL